MSICRSIVRILGKDGKPEGGGFLATAGFVVTCAHVVRDALGIQKGQEPERAPKEQISLDFPFFEDAPIATDIVWWRYRSVAGEPSGFRDLAILRLPSAPDLAQNATLMIEPPADFSRFCAHGFHRADGHWIDGAYRGARGDGWLQLRGEALEHYFVEGGFSGCPVVLTDDKTGSAPFPRVFGLIALGEGEGLTQEAFAIPSGFIAAALEACGKLSKSNELDLLRAARDDLATCFDEGKPNINDPRFRLRMEKLLKSLDDDLSEFDEAKPDIHVQNIAERARALSGLYTEAAERGYARHFVRIGFDPLAEKLSALTEGAKVDDSGRAGLIPNDWQDDGMEVQIQRIEELLAEVDDLEDSIKGGDLNLPDDERTVILGALRRLKDELLEPTIDPLALADIQQRLEGVKSALDAFRRLLTLQELFLGRHAGLLPPGSIFRDADFAPSMVVVPPGAFDMGSHEDEEGRFDDEGPQHRVTIERRFALGRYAVTFEEFDRFCTDHSNREPPSDEDWGRGRRPVINVSCEDAEAYLAWLSDRCSAPYRLLSEAEWEYACRSGTVSRYSFGDGIDETVANYNGNIGKTTDVGSYEANPFGLYDMHGNVWEWCADPWHEDYDGAPTDGSAWLDGGDASQAVVRGGSWGSQPGPLPLRLPRQGTLATDRFTSMSVSAPPGPLAEGQGYSFVH